MKIRLTGADELRKALAEFSINADRELANVVRGTAQNIRRHANKSIARGTKSGIVYEKYDPRRTHRASAPGEAPARDSGRLDNSIQADIQGKQATVFTNLEYAPWLEFGTQKIEPRPFMVPAMEKERPKFEQRLSRIVDAAAKGIIK